MSATGAQVCSGFVDGLRADTAPWFVVFRGGLLTVSKSQSADSKSRSADSQQITVCWQQITVC
jgi:hypothetical protein